MCIEASVEYPGTHVQKGELNLHFPGDRCTRFLAIVAPTPIRTRAHTSALPPELPVTSRAALERWYILLCLLNIQQQDAYSGLGH